MNFTMSRQLRMNQEFNPGYQEVPVTSTYRMLSADTVLKVDSSAGAFTVYLPPVAEVGGADYAIKQVAATPAVVTIVDRGDSVAWTNRTLSTATAVMIFASDGEQWYLLLSIA